MDLIRTDERAGALSGGMAACWLIGFLLAPGGCRNEPQAGTAALPVGSAAQAGIPEGIQIETNTFTSAHVCGACHQAIHASWQQSMHSRAFTNGVFQASYREAKRLYPTEHAQLCLTCHAPTVRNTGDYAAQLPMTKEGVTCDFCHSVRGVNLDTPQEVFELSLGRTKYGPLRHAQSPAHMTLHSELHLHSALCAGCHEYHNHRGVAVLETYSEWKASPYAGEGKHCQNCHMPLIPGRVAALGLKTAARDGLNLHDISGSRDLERVRQAVHMTILRAERMGEERVDVQISVRNAGCGHCFPTGLPTHRAELEVTLTDRGRTVGRRTIAFEKVLLNEQGLPLTREHELFVEAHSIRSDTRLRPKEQRLVDVVFRGASAPEGVVKAALWYEYPTRTLVTRDGVETTEPVEMKYLVASAKRPLPPAGD